jgi:hypothetical protein
MKPEDLELLLQNGICVPTWLLLFGERGPREAGCRDCIYYRTACGGGRNPIRCVKGKQPRPGEPAFTPDGKRAVVCNGNCRRCPALSPAAESEKAPPR